MIINIQAFNATGADNRRIYEELDEFQSRKPIDVIKANNAILILDEPQKMGAEKTLDALKNFEALFVLRYSATHKVNYNTIHRLDAIDAYNQKLVKKIAVRGISTQGLLGVSAHLYVESIDICKYKKKPMARIEIEVKQKNDIKRMSKLFELSDNLYVKSNELEQYKKGFVISQIDSTKNIVEFTNGLQLNAGEAVGDITEITTRRFQIRETIRAHFTKEVQVFEMGIKVLSLFFIDEVAKYRDYTQENQKGEYANIFEEEYQNILAEYLQDDELSKEYKEYLSNIHVQKTHNGYFAIDKKTGHLKDPSIKKRGGEGESDDIDAYSLILKDKERLLSFKEPVRFIFSHSALREGWDNPNVFVICTLKHANSKNIISRRQEIGRGLRLSVNQHGDRMDDPNTVHDINVLTVVANESYSNFVAELQKEMKESLAGRKYKIDIDFFKDKLFKNETNEFSFTEKESKIIYKYLTKNDYINETDELTQKYHEARQKNTLELL